MATNYVSIPTSDLTKTYIYPDVSLNDGNYMTPFNGFIMLGPYNAIQRPDISFNEKAKLTITSVRDDNSIENFWWFADISQNNYVFTTTPYGSTSNYGVQPNDISLIELGPKSSTNQRIKLRFDIAGKNTVLSLSSPYTTATYPYVQTAEQVKFVSSTTANETFIA